MKQPYKSLAEMGPLLLFFLSYKYYGLIPATGLLVAATIIAVAATYMVEKKVPMVPVISAVVLSIFGGLTFFSGDDLFIKLKPTIVNIIFAAILFIGVMRGKGLLKYLLGEALDMNDKAWVTLSFRWGLFFLFLAGLNEVIWRNFDTDFWVQFKVFGMLTCTIIFTLSQVAFVKANMSGK